MGGKGWISPQLINPRRASAAGLRYSVCVFVCVTALKSKVRNHRILHGIFKKICNVWLSLKSFVQKLF